MVAEIVPGEANFLHVRLANDRPASAGHLRRALLERFNIVVRDVSGSTPDHSSRIRVAVRNQVDNERLVQALRALEDEVANG